MKWIEQRTARNISYTIIGPAFWGRLWAGYAFSSRLQPYSDDLLRFHFTPSDWRLWCCFASAARLGLMLTSALRSLPFLFSTRLSLIVA
jgi:hypothetical protein